MRATSSLPLLPGSGHRNCRACCSAATSGSRGCAMAWARVSGGGGRGGRAAGAWGAAEQLLQRVGGIADVPFSSLLKYELRLQASLAQDRRQYARSAHTACHLPEIVNHSFDSTPETRHWARERQGALLYCETYIYIYIYIVHYIEPVFLHSPAHPHLTHTRTRHHLLVVKLVVRLPVMRQR